MTIGSLFDGSGTAPLAATMLGGTPLWASEIEPYPIAVTKARFPNMTHLGSITEINGAEVEPVEVIVGGSPCQDLSVAGKQAGLENGTRSNLFYEMTRIIREMREATHGKYPRFVVWENVPGAFSSNKGRDFLSVVEAFCAIADDSVHIPEPEKDRKTGRLAWKNAGAVVGDGWSFAWRVLDAQYWGVPQRRRRIFAVLDLGSERAGEILFEREGVRRDFETRFPEGKGAAGGAATGAGGAGGGGRAVAFEPGAASRLGGHCLEELAGTLRADAGDNQTAVVYDARGNGGGEIANTLTGDHENRVTDYTALAAEPCAANMSGQSGVNSAPMVMAAFGVCAHNSGAMLSANPRSGFYPRTALTTPKSDKPRYIVRRLTPTECARLQGFPDWWADGIAVPNPTEEDIAFWTEVWETHRKVMNPDGKPKTRKQIVKWLRDPGSDSNEYKMWGNGMALPCMLAVLNGVKGAM